MTWKEKEIIEDIAQVATRHQDENEVLIHIANLLWHLADGDKHINTEYLRERYGK